MSLAKNGQGLTWHQWCAKAGADPSKFVCGHFFGEHALMWYNNVRPEKVRTMKDKNGRNIYVGDMVRFFPREEGEVWYEGLVLHIESDVENNGSKVAHITKEHDEQAYWRRHSEMLEKV